MGFADDLNASLDDLMEIGGEPATWNGQAITVLPGQAGVTSTGSPGLAGVSTEAIQVREADIGGQPQAGATVVYRGRTWSATPYPTASAGLWQVELHAKTITAG